MQSMSAFFDPWKMSVQAAALLQLKINTSWVWPYQFHISMEDDRKIEHDLAALRKEVWKVPKNLTKFPRSANISLSPRIGIEHQ